MSLEAPLRTESTMYFKNEHHHTSFDVDLTKAEESVPFGKITRVAPNRWAYRAGVVLEEGENGNDATARILMGVDGIAFGDHPPNVRFFRNLNPAWVGASATNRKSLKKIVRKLGKRGTGTDEPQELEEE